MIIAKVVGSVISTRKNEQLVGSKFMVVEPLHSHTATSKIVAVDKVGAGIGEIVLISTGSAARIVCGCEKAPIDAVIVGIIDDDCNIDF